MGNKRGKALKHVPQRTCLACRETKPKRQLTRLVRADGRVVVDPSGKLSGRGAYLCQTASCRERAVKTDVIGQALRVDLTEDERVELSAQLSAVS